MKEFETITIGTDGKIRHIDHEPLAPLKQLGTVTRRRASHIEPVNPVLRVLFHAIRRVVSDGSSVAVWTRSWPCLWQVNIIDGPTWGRFVNRREAIVAEIGWLQANGY